MAARLSLLLAATVLAGCAPPTTPAPPLDAKSFNSTNAFTHVAKLVAFGPRPSGSAALGQAADYLKAQLTESGLTVEIQEFTAPTPRGPMRFRNVIGRTKVQRASEPVILFASHYDTKNLPEIKFVGANDGGSSAGVLLELARIAAQQPNVWFVFFDGEECLVNYGRHDGFQGSQYFVESLKAARQTTRVKALVLLDMIGGVNLKVTIPSNSSPELSQLVFAAARAAGHRDLFSFRNGEIGDDHLAFLEAGIPAVDMIDFEYGSAPGRNDYWHTEQDTLDKLSPHSLAVMGETSLHLLALLQRAASPLR